MAWGSYSDWTICSAATPRPGFPIAVVYKYVDDQGGYLAALITYYGFLSLFPLLLLLASLLGFAAARTTHTCSSRSSTRRSASSR